MSHLVPTALHDDIQARVSAGGYASEEALLRDALRALDEEEEEEDLKAAKAAVAEWRAGDEGLPLKEAFDEIRHGR